MCTERLIRNTWWETENRVILDGSEGSFRLLQVPYKGGDHAFLAADCFVSDVHLKTVEDALWVLLR